MDTFSDIFIALIAGLPAIIVAVSGYLRNKQELVAQNQTIEKQNKEIEALKTENKALRGELETLRRENKDLSEHNKFLQDVLSEYREKLIPCIQHAADEPKSRPRRGSDD